MDVSSEQGWELVREEKILQCRVKNQRCSGDILVSISGCARGEDQVMGNLPLWAS